MAEDRSMSNNSGFPAVFLGHADNVLSSGVHSSTVVNHDGLKAMINMYLLLYRRVAIADSFIIANPSIRKIIYGDDDWGMIEAIKDGVILTTMRQDYSSFSDLERFLRGSKTYYGQIQRDFSEFSKEIDQLPWIKLVHSQERFYKDFTDSVECAISDEQLMRELGLYRRKDEINDYMLRRKDKFNGNIRRTFIYDFVNEHWRRRTRPAFGLEKLSNVLYHQTYAKQLGLSPSFPPNWSDVSNLVYGNISANTDPAPYLEEMLPFSIFALQLLDYQTIKYIRNSDAFEVFQSQVESIAIEYDGLQAGKEYYAVLLEYFRKIEQALTMDVINESLLRLKIDTNISEKKSIVKLTDRGIEFVSHPEIQLPPSLQWLIYYGAMIIKGTISASIESDEYFRKEVFSSSRRTAIDLYPKQSLSSSSSLSLVYHPESL